MVAAVEVEEAPAENWNGEEAEAVVAAVVVVAAPEKLKALDAVVVAAVDVAEAAWPKLKLGVAKEGAAGLAAVVAVVVVVEAPVPKVNIEEVLAGKAGGAVVVVVVPAGAAAAAEAPKEKMLLAADVVVVVAAAAVVVAGVDVAGLAPKANTALGAADVAAVVLGVLPKVNRPPPVEVGAAGVVAVVVAAADVAVGFPKLKVGEATVDPAPNVAAVVVVVAAVVAELEVEEAELPKLKETAGLGAAAAAASSVFFSVAAGFPKENVGDTTGVAAAAEVVVVVAPEGEEVLDAPNWNMGEATAVEVEEHVAAAVFPKLKENPPLALAAVAVEGVLLPSLSSLFSAPLLSFVSPSSFFSAGPKLKESFLAAPSGLSVSSEPFFLGSLSFSGLLAAASPNLNG